MSTVATGTSTSASTGTGTVTLGQVCAEASLGIDVRDILPLMMMKSIFGGGAQGGFNIDALLQLLIAQRLKQALLNKVEVPAQYRDFAEIICYAINADDIKLLTAAMRGETPQIDIGSMIEKTMGLVFAMKLLAKYS